MSIIDDLKKRLAEKKKKPKRLEKVPRLSLKPESGYAKRLLKIAEMVNAATEAEIIPRLPILYETENWPAIIDNLIRGTGSHLELAINPVFIATPWAREVQIAATNQWEATVKAAFGVDVSGLLSPAPMQPFVDAAIDTNVALIKSIPAKHLATVQQIITDGRNQNMTVAKIAKAIREEYPVTKRRAKLIAADQSQKLAATINQQRQAEAGIDSYIWRGQMDKRERKLHVARQNKVFKWASPPSDGHPGQPVMCRCHAMPNFNDDEEGAF